MPDYPEFKYSYRKMRCYRKAVYVDCTSTYQYIPEKNMYRLIKQTCSRNMTGVGRSYCSGRSHGGLCELLTVTPIEVPPDASDFEPQSHLSE